jgi:hypothetical protein
MTVVKIEAASATERAAMILDINSLVLFSHALFTGLGAGVLFYAKTRLPFFAKDRCLALLVFGLIVSAFMTIPGVGLNESAHTFWSINEGSMGPLHWEFIFLGWMSLAASAWRYKSSAIVLTSSAQKRLRNR